MILAGLRSLDSVSGSHYYRQLMEKLKSGSSDYMSGSESILIDLSSWYKDSLLTRIEPIQRAIEARAVIRFRYCAPGGDSVREIEPYYLVFKWSSWYVWGWCRLREDYRLFKLTRMNDIVQTGGQAADRIVPVPDLSTEKVFPGEITVKAIFQPEMRWHLIEEFGEDSFVVQPDGTLLFEHKYTDRESLIAWMLTCRDKVKVLEPEDVRDEILRIANHLIEMYGTGFHGN